MDGYRSYITANVIAYYMQYIINIFILPLYISYVLQLVDVSVFSLLKRALAAETNAVL